MNSACATRPARIRLGTRDQVGDQVARAGPDARGQDESRDLRHFADSGHTVGGAVDVASPGVGDARLTKCR
jgi:hypothetical protein